MAKRGSVPVCVEVKEEAEEELLDAAALAKREHRTLVNRRKAARARQRKKAALLNMQTLVKGLQGDVLAQQSQVVEFKELYQQLVLEHEGLQKRLTMLLERKVKPADSPTSDCSCPRPAIAQQASIINRNTTAAAISPPSAKNQIPLVHLSNSFASSSPESYLSAGNEGKPESGQFDMPATKRICRPQPLPDPTSAAICARRNTPPPGLAPPNSLLTSAPWEQQQRGCNSFMQPQPAPQHCLSAPAAAPMPVPASSDASLPSSWLSPGTARWTQMQMQQHLPLGAGLPMLPSLQFGMPAGHDLQLDLERALDNAWAHCTPPDHVNVPAFPQFAALPQQEAVNWQPTFCDILPQGIMAAAPNLEPAATAWTAAEAPVEEPATAGAMGVVSGCPQEQVIVDGTVKEGSPLSHWWENMPTSPVDVHQLFLDEDL